MTSPMNQPAGNQQTLSEPFHFRCQKVLHVASNLFQRNPDWVTFFREVLGVNGAARDQFRTNEEYLKFEQSEEFGQIQQMVSSLRGRKMPGGSHNEPTRVITVRLPESVHEALKVEASDHKTSMNKLCIAKLLQVLAESEAANATARGKTMDRGSHSPAATPSPPVGNGSSQPAYRPQVNRPGAGSPPAAPRDFRSVNPPAPAAQPAPSAPAAPSFPLAPTSPPAQSHSSPAPNQSRPESPAPNQSESSSQQTRFGNRF